MVLERDVEIHVGRDGQVVGVYPHGSIAYQIEIGQILPTDLAWAAGETDWLVLTDFARKHGVPLSTGPDQPHATNGSTTSQESVDVTDGIAQPRPVFPTGVLIARSCPRCDSKNIKKISLIVREGTIDHETTSSVSGTGYVGSSPVHVSGRRTDSGTSKSRLAAVLSEELQMDEANSGSFVGAIFLVVGVVVGYFAGRYTGSSIVGWAVGIVTFVVSAVFLNSKPNKAAEQLNRWREHGHYCHQCAHRFIPGSDEAYPYLSDGE